MSGEPIHHVRRQLALTDGHAVVARARRAKEPPKASQSRLGGAAGTADRLAWFDTLGPLLAPVASNNLRALSHHSNILRIIIRCAAVKAMPSIGRRIHSHYDFNVGEIVTSARACSSGSNPEII